MPLDETLLRVLDTLNQRIRDDVARRLEAADAELTHALEAARAGAMAQAAAEAATQAAAHTESVRQEAFEAGREEGLREGREAERVASDEILQAIIAIDRGRSLSEVLDALAAGAARSGGRAAVLTVRDHELRGWRFVGFGGALSNPLAVVLSPENGGIVSQALSTHSAVSSETGAGVQPPPFADLPAGRRMFATPLDVGGRSVAVLYADTGQEESVPRPGWTAALEAIARHAARSLEAVTAFRTAALLAPRPVGVAASVAVSQDDEAARRYARLLVSEIKLYHGTAVAEGCRERDLASRLEGEISRARAMYEERIPLHVRHRADHFHAELVRTLANGDATLLEGIRA
jgi:hypothetical protein